MSLRHVLACIILLASTAAPYRWRPTPHERLRGLDEPATAARPAGEPRPGADDAGREVAMTHTLSDSTHSREVAPVPRLCVPQCCEQRPAAWFGRHRPAAVDGPSRTTERRGVIRPSNRSRVRRVEGRETRNVGRNTWRPGRRHRPHAAQRANVRGLRRRPYLAGQIATANVQGIQSRCHRHAQALRANNQETDRDTVNELIDDQTIHEIYAPPTRRRQARASRVIMCAKNKVNGVYACDSRPCSRVF